MSLAYKDVSKPFTIWLKWCGRLDVCPRRETWLIIAQEWRKGTIKLIVNI
ncbi:MAG: hypothetical protein ACFFCW_41435 [Candidatus Hodarchaeota archaeon]